MNQEQTRPELIPTLHGFRGWLALWVMLFHLSPTGGSFFPMAAYGYSAVDLFFMLSGYVLMHSHFFSMESGGAGKTAAFLKSRLWRTYPLYLACVLIGLTPYLLSGSLPPPERLAVALFLLEGWALPGLAGNPPVWSLGVEWIGYLIFPLLVSLCVKIDRRTALDLLLLVLAAELILLANMSAGVLDVNSGLPAFIRMAGGFVGGCLLWVIHKETGDRAPSHALALPILCGIAVLVFASLPPIMIVPVYMLILDSVVRADRWAMRILAHPFSLFLGRISFALYLSHFLVLKTALHYQDRLVAALDSDLLGRAAATMTAVAAAIVLATLLCMSIEEPARRFGRRLSLKDGAMAIPSFVRQSSVGGRNKGGALTRADELASSTKSLRE